MIWLKNHDRITIDVDKPSLFLCLKKLAYGLRLLHCSFDVYLSSGKKGFHIIFHKVYPYWKILFYRLLIGDDKKRLWYDFLRLLVNEPQLFDLLFDRYRKRGLVYWKRHYKITDYATSFMNQLPISATYISDATYIKNKKTKGLRNDRNSESCHSSVMDSMVSKNNIPRGKGKDRREKRNLRSYNLT